MIETHDTDVVRCRRLGDDVPFRYCRQENDGKPCRLVLDCWWQRFDVQAFLRENLEPELYDEIASGFQPPDKIVSLFDLIQKARERVESERGAE
ncbi:hypothetical protein JW916_06255 [Candidatus Sumerlaeota bacterium]|nr:hypothetical protein [Candidatus Sumerlaeota bacterium]